MREATVLVTAAKKNYTRENMCFAALAQCFVLIETRATAISVNTFRNPNGEVVQDKLELARSTRASSGGSKAFHATHANESPAMLKRLQKAVIENHNVFEVLMQAVGVCSLGQITNALFEVGGQYRRNR